MCFLSSLMHSFSLSQGFLLSASPLSLNHCPPCSYSPRNQLRRTKLAEKCFMICMHMQFPGLSTCRASRPQDPPVRKVLNPRVRRGGVVTCFIVEFTIGAGSGIEVHVISGGLESQVHIHISGGRGTMDRIFKKWLLKVPVGVLVDRICLVVFAWRLLGCGWCRDLGQTQMKEFQLNLIRIGNSSLGKTKIVSWNDIT